MPESWQPAAGTVLRSFDMELNERDPRRSPAAEFAPRDTKIIELDPENIDPEKIKLCGEVIRQGGLVCFPTETVYGLGANALDPKAVGDIFKAKGRPNDNPLIVHIADYSLLELVSAADERQRGRFERLGEKFWPGPLTIIVDKSPSIPEEVSCGLDTVGIRLPSSKIARALIKAAGVPIAAPSANLSGKPSPSTAEHVIQDLMGRVDIIISGGNCSVGVESTVLDVTSDVPTILRPGAVTLENVRETLGAGELIDWKRPAGEKPKSPGMKYTHYSPNAEVVIYDGILPKIREKILDEISRCGEKNTGILTTDDGVEYYKKELGAAGLSAIILSMGDREDPITMTRALFARLREFDGLGAEKVLAEAVPAVGIGNAVMNRLYRAAGGNIINTEEK